MTDVETLTFDDIDNDQAFGNESDHIVREEVNPLQQVFSACDYNGDGYVKIADLVALAQKYAQQSGNGEELELLLEQFDEHGDGRITFEEFVQKVQEVMRTPRRGSLSDVDILTGVQGNVDILNSVQEDDVPSLTITPETPQKNGQPRTRSNTDSEGFFEEGDSGSHSTTSTNDYYGDLEEHFTTPPAKLIAEGSTEKKHDIYSTYPLNGKYPRKSHTTLFEIRRQQLSRTSEYQSNEEDFESEDADESHYSTPQMDPLHLGSRGGIRYVQSARNSIHGSNEDMTCQKHSYSDGETDYNFLSEEIQKLSAELSLMKMDQSNHNTKQYKMQEDNKVLVNRINALEEQLVDQKELSVQTVEEQNVKYKKQLQKIQLEHEDRLHQLTIKLSDAEQEITNLKTVEPMLRKEIELSLEERRLAQKRIDSLQTELLEKEREIQQLKYKLRSKQDELDRLNKERTEEVLMLTQEIDSLKYCKSAALNSYDERMDLLQQIELLKKENDNLKISKDDLCNQLLQQGAMMELDKKSSLADELAGANKDDVLDALRSEEGENHRLRQYIDQLLILIMQSNPLLLEK